MPEGDTLYRIAAALREAFGDACITSVRTRDPAWQAMDTARPVSGRRLAAIEARGKHLLLVCRAEDAGPLLPAAQARLDLALHAHDWIVHSHLGMRGAWWIDPPQTPPRALAPRTWALDTPRGSARCVAPQTLRVLSPRELLAGPVAALGPDLTRDGVDLEAAARALAACGDDEIAVALLRQRALAGIGNVVKSEALFAAGVSPFARVSDLGAADLRRVLGEAVRILHANRGRPGRRRTVPGGAAAPSHGVYRRAGEACLRCATPIAAVSQGAEARRTYFCPACQRAGGASSGCGRAGEGK